jgi:hypothetical protein
MCIDLHFACSLPLCFSELIILKSVACEKPGQWFAGCILLIACVPRQKPGCIVTTLFGTVESTDIQAIPAETPKKKHGWLPLLTVLFMISYGLMTMLIVEQGQTIESQRALIRELFHDSTELTATKLKALQDGRSQAAQSVAPRNPAAPTQQAPSTQAQRQAPSSQAVPQQRAQIQVRPKFQFQMPSKPASDLQDNRRALITI